MAPNRRPGRRHGYAASYRPTDIHPFGGAVTLAKGVNS